MLPLITAALALAPALDDKHDNWITLDSVSFDPAEPTVIVLPDQSSSDRTVVRVQIPGVFTDVVTAADGNPYTRLSLPGWSSTTEDLGAPELPVLRFHLAVPASAAQSGYCSTAFDTADATVSLRLEELAPDEPVAPPIWPVHTPAFDGDPDEGTPNGIPAGFAFDPDAYAGGDHQPITPIDALLVINHLGGGVEGVLVEVRPFRWNGLTDTVDIVTDFEVGFEHQSTGAPTTISAQARAVASGLTLNFFEVENEYPQPQAATGDASRLLVMAPKEHLDELLPLIDQRRYSGLDVDFIAREELPSVDAATVAATIDGWADQLPPAAEGYVLLVGGGSAYPFLEIKGIEGESSDAGYGEHAGVHVGRLIPAYGADLALQIDKLVEAERSNATADNLKQFGLALFGAEPTYEEFGDELEMQIAAKYFQPEINTVDTSSASSTPKLLETVDDGVAFLFYRGPGSTSAWPGFQGGVSVSAGDLSGLDNDVPPIHWALAPSTADAATGGSLAEAWMRGEHGALAAYGAVTTTPTDLTHEVGHWLGLMHTAERALRHGKLLDAAEFAAEQTYAGEGTSVSDRFQLIGDPSMVVANGNSAATDDVFIDGKIITAENYDSVWVELGFPSASVEVKVADENGDPVEGALVSLVVGHSSIGSDGELVQLPSQDDAYTDEGGAASLAIDLSADDLAKLPASMHTAGINVMMADGSVRFLSDSIALIGADFDNLGGEVANAIGQAPRLLSIDTVEGGETLELLVENGRPLSAGALFVAFQHNPVPFEGGVFHALPVGLSFPFATDAAGDAPIVLGPLPNPIPQGLELVFQAVVADPSGPLGLTLSNGLLFVD